MKKEIIIFEIVEDFILVEFDTINMEILDQVPYPSIEGEKTFKEYWEKTLKLEIPVVKANSIQEGIINFYLKRK